MARYQSSQGDGWVSQLSFDLTLSTDPHQEVRAPTYLGNDLHDQISLAGAERVSVEEANFGNDLLPNSENSQRSRQRSKNVQQKNLDQLVSKPSEALTLYSTCAT